MFQTRDIVTKKRFHYGVRILIAVCVLGLFFWSSSLDSNVNTFSIAPFDVLVDGWVQVVDGVEVPLDAPLDAQYPEDGSPIVLQGILPDVEGDRALVFYAIHQEVAVYIDDVLVYTLTCPEELSSFVSPGRAWVEIPITMSAMGKTIRMEFSSPFSLYRSAPATFYFVSAGEAPSLELRYMGLQNIAAVAILLLAIVSYMNARIWNATKLRHFLFSMADLYLFTGLWLCSETSMISLLVGHSAAASVLAMIFIRLVPVGFYHFVLTTTTARPLWMRIVGVLAWGNLILCVLLQVVFGISLVATLPLAVLVIGVSCVAYLVGIALRWKRQRFSSQHDISFYATAVLLLGTMAEIFCYVEQGSLGHLSGIFVSVACIIYACIAHVVLVQNEVDTDAEKRRLEQNYHTLEKKPLDQQINAHFLFNTLNTISAYCKQHPALADQAVGWLAQYMRIYMRLIDCGEYVPFTEEVSLIQLYLKIQNLRYDDQISFVVDSNWADFCLPPLTLQPLVENAVAHGLHGFTTQGEIRVTTHRHGDRVEMVVSDNGCGFQLGSEPKNNGMALTNLTRRIKAMGGDLRVKSTVGKGTTVILSVPLTQSNYREKESS